MTGRSAPRSPALPPHDLAAEAALVGGALIFPERVENIAADVQALHFYRPAHGVMWAAITGLIGQGITRLDYVLVADRCRSVDPTFDESLVPQMMANAIAPQRAHAEIILRHAAARAALADLAQATADIHAGADPYQVAGQTAKALDKVGPAIGDQPEAMTMPELVAQADHLAPEVIGGLPRLDWRLVVVAGEGSGKSTLLRQLAVCVGQGIHPLRFTRVPPVRALVVDAENSLAAIAETGARLDRQARLVAGDSYEPGRCRTWSRPGGLDLREPRDRAALIRELRAQKPQLVCAGPLYKLGGRHQGESYEDAAEGVQHVLDDLRTRFGFALVIEHHAPKGDGSGSREMAPFGSQRWLAWPELGLGLKPDKETGGLLVRRFRGDRMASDWPDKLVRGQVWPFEGVWHKGLRVVS
jgi:replicative DNA helicase